MKLLAKPNLQELKQEEKRLFDTYNWRAKSDVKVEHLKRLITVIEQIERCK